MNTTAHSSYEKIDDIRSHFNEAFEPAIAWGSWEKIAGALTWKRSRMTILRQILPVPFSLVATARPKTPEWQGPTYILGEGEGEVAQTVALSERQIALRRRFSSRIGETVIKEWHLHTNVRPNKLPEIDARDLTEDEINAHADYRGTQPSQLIMHAPPAIDMKLYYDVRGGWSVHEGREQGKGYSTDSQVGQLMLSALHERALNILPSPQSEL